jgi:UDP-glucose 4-epimerase
MKIVITGALGHIGSKLIRELPTQFPEAEIVMIDNLMTQRYCSLFHLPKRRNYRFVEGDVTQVDMRSIMEGAHTVVHLAAITDAAGSFDRAEQLELNNYTATQRVTEACLDSGTRMIHLSSTSVYGTQKELVDEDCPEEDLKPQSPYATTKLKEERLVRRMVSEQKLRATTCRFGTIFGVSPGMRFHTAVNKFCWQAAMGQEITVWRTAYDQKRPYLDLDDACNAIEQLIRKDLFDGEVYNVLTLNATVRQIVETIREFVPHLEIRFVDSPVMNQLSYEVSREKIVSVADLVFSDDIRSTLEKELEALGVTH